jgi:hypothetical protein
MVSGKALSGGLVELGMGVVEPGRLVEGDGVTGDSPVWLLRDIS